MARDSSTVRWAIAVTHSGVLGLDGRRPANAINCRTTPAARSADSRTIARYSPACGAWRNASSTVGMIAASMC